MSRNREIYQICWFRVNSKDYSASLARTHDGSKLPDEYLPLDNFQGEYGYFYDKNSEAVLRLGPGTECQDFHEGTLKPQWPDFNSFLERYFELTDH